MKVLHKNILCLAMFSFALMSTAQNTMDYIILSSSINANGQTLSIESTITKTNSILNWLQNDDGESEQTSFNIVSASGSWDQSTSIGSLTYELERNGSLAQLVITGTAMELTAKLTYIISDSQQQEYSFNDNTINYQ